MSQASPANRADLILLQLTVVSKFGELKKA